MKIIDVTGKPCPIPVIEAKKALAEDGVRGVLVKVDNLAAVQNLGKMANGLGYGFSYAETGAGRYVVSIGERKPAYDDSSGEALAVDSQAGGTADIPIALQNERNERNEQNEQNELNEQNRQNKPNEQNEQNKQCTQAGFVVAIGCDSMGGGDPELGKILIKGFLYALSELPAAPSHIIFYNSGAYLTAADANTIEDLRKLESKGTTVITCGTCVNYYGLQPPAAGAIANMYDIVEIIANACKVVNI